MMKKILRKIKNKSTFFFHFFIFFTFLWSALFFFHFVNAADDDQPWYKRGLNWIKEKVKAPVTWAAKKTLGLAADVIVAIALFVPFLIANTFLFLAIVIFKVALNFIVSEVSLTTFENPIISAGFPPVQGLANIIIIFGILVVGLATILGIEEYRAQRKLPALIICALLLNFSNVLCGFVVDISNVLTFHFLKDTIQLNLLYDNLKGVFSHFYDLEKLAAEIFGPNSGNFAAVLFTSTIFCFLAGNIIIILAFLLIVRTIAIPVFVVLAPVAIASYVMPEIPLPEAFFGHRKFFDWWLKQFLEWCFIGVTVSFFTYLACMYIPARVYADLDINDVTGFFHKIAPYFAVLFLLYLGMQVGFKTSAIGASAVIAFGQTAASALMGMSAVLVGGGLAAGRLAGGLLGRIPGVGKIGSAMGSIGGAMKTTYEKIIPSPRIRAGLESGVRTSIYAIREGVKMATGFEYAGRAEESKKRFRESEEEFEKERPNIDKLAQTILNPFTILEKKLAAWNFAKKTGQLANLMEALRDRKADPNKLLIVHIQGIAPINPDLAKSLVKINPHLADQIKQGLSKQTAEAIGLKDLKPEEIKAGITLPIKILMQLSPSEIVSVNPEFQNSKDFRKFMARWAKVSQLRKFLEEGHPKAVENFIKVAQKVGLEYFEKYNPAAAEYFKHSTTRAMGIIIPKKKK